jgi:hypothetical protein
MFSLNALGETFARERNGLIWLEHGDVTSYDVKFQVLDSNRFPPLHGRKSRLNEDHSGAVSSQ